VRARTHTHKHTHSRTDTHRHAQTAHTCLMLLVKSQLFALLGSSVLCARTSRTALCTCVWCVCVCVFVCCVCVCVCASLSLSVRASLWVGGWVGGWVGDRERKGRGRRREGGGEPASLRALGGVRLFAVVSRKFRGRKHACAPVVLPQYIYTRVYVRVCTCLYVCIYIDVRDTYR
jgi:hypothetical protein